MKIIKDSIICLAKKGRATLQVPDIVIGVAPELVDCPDEWFVKLTNRNGIPSVQGFLFLTQAGYEANKKDLLCAYASAGGSPTDFEAMAETQFHERKNAVAKEILKLKKKIAKLEAASN